MGQKKGYKCSLEHKRNISISKLGSNNPQYGKTPWNKGKRAYMVNK